MTMLLVHASPTTLEEYRHANLGVLCSPRRVYGDELAGWTWAADNDAFSNWDSGRFRAMLQKIAGRDGCRFVTCPDVVGDAEETEALFRLWRDEVAISGQPIAYVAQDGLDFVPPWDEFDALFVGGTTEFKLSHAAAMLVQDARTRGKWVHMGRVNTQRRLFYAKAIGCDSVDGTQFSWFRDRWLRAFLDYASEPRQLAIGSS